MSGAPGIGDLRQRVTIETFARVPDGGGGANGSWTTVADVWAALLPAGGGEAFNHDRVAGRQAFTVWMRHRDGVRPEMRLRLENRVFDIRSVADVEERGRWLRLDVEERDL